MNNLSDDELRILAAINNRPISEVKKEDRPLIRVLEQKRLITASFSFQTKTGRINLTCLGKQCLEIKNLQK